MYQIYNKALFSKFVDWRDEPVGNRSQNTTAHRQATQEVAMHEFQYKGRPE